MSTFSAISGESVFASEVQATPKQKKDNTTESEIQRLHERGRAGLFMNDSKGGMARICGIIVEVRSESKSHKVVHLALSCRSLDVLARLPVGGSVVFLFFRLLIHRDSCSRQCKSAVQLCRGQHPPSSEGVERFLRSSGES